MPIHIKGSGGGKASPVGFGFTDHYTESDSKIIFGTNDNFITFQPKDALSVVDLSQITGVENVSIYIESISNAWTDWLFVTREGEGLRWGVTTEFAETTGDPPVFAGGYIVPTYNKTTGKFTFECQGFESIALSQRDYTLRASITWKIG